MDVNFIKLMRHSTVYKFLVFTGKNHKSRVENIYIINNSFSSLDSVIVVFKIRSETWRTKAQFCQNLYMYMVKKESLLTDPSLAGLGPQSGSYFEDCYSMLYMKDH